jgi:hypothetical protein
MSFTHKLIKVIFAIKGCRHRWKQIGKHNVYGYTNKELPLYYDYVLQCEKCGDIRRRRT